MNDDEDTERPPLTDELEALWRWTEGEEEEEDEEKE